MQYHVSRNGQVYGPYTLDDLQRYVASGNVLLTDTAKSDDMAEWVPVSQLLGSSTGAASYEPVAGAPAPGSVSGYAPSPAGYPGASPAFGSAIAFPDPPNLSWGLLLLFGLLTCGVFTVIYDLIQAFWWKRIFPPTKVVLFYAICYACYFVNVLSTGANVHGLHHGRLPHNLLGSLASIAGFVLLLFARFTFRSELEQHYNGPEPVGLNLSGVMTFFFGGLYFQYHFNRINAIKQGIRYAAGVPPR